MLTDRMFREYCSQIREVEEKMERYYRELSEELSNPEYRSIFERLAGEEAGHQARINEIIALFEEG